MKGQLLVQFYGGPLDGIEGQWVEVRNFCPGINDYTATAFTNQRGAEVLIYRPQFHAMYALCEQRMRIK